MGFGESESISDLLMILILILNVDGSLCKFVVEVVYCWKFILGWTCEVTTSTVAKIVRKAGPNFAEEMSGCLGGNSLSSTLLAGHPVQCSSRLLFPSSRYHFWSIVGIVVSKRELFTIR